MACDPALERALADVGWKLTELRDGQSTLNRRLARLEQTIQREGVLMVEVDARLATLQSTLGDVGTALADDTAEVERVIADLKTALGGAGALTPGQAAAFDALDALGSNLKASAQAIKDAVETADPTPAPTPAPTPEPIPAPEPTPPTA